MSAANTPPLTITPTWVMLSRAAPIPGKFLSQQGSVRWLMLLATCSGLHCTSCNTICCYSVLLHSSSAGIVMGDGDDLHAANAVSILYLQHSIAHALLHALHCAVQANSGCLAITRLRLGLSLTNAVKLQCTAGRG